MPCAATVKGEGTAWHTNLGRQVQERTRTAQVCISTCNANLAAAKAFMTTGLNMSYVLSGFFLDQECQISRSKPLELPRVVLPLHVSLVLNSTVDLCGELSLSL